MNLEELSYSLRRQTNSGKKKGRATYTTDSNTARESVWYNTMHKYQHNFHDIHQEEIFFFNISNNY